MKLLTKIAELCDDFLKIAAIGVVLALAGCHINGSSTEGHDENGNRLTFEGKPCHSPSNINVYANIVSQPAHDILLEKLGFDPGVDRLYVYTTNSSGQGPNIGIQVTDSGNCLVLLGELSRTELARMLGIKTFGGIDQ